MEELRKYGEIKGINFCTELIDLQKRKVTELRRIYNNLTAWETVQVARHPKRPILPDYIEYVVKQFVELHGDKCFGDDPSIITGFAHIGHHKVMIVGHNKGRSLEEKGKCKFGCADPEGYRKALQKMKIAEKFGLPIITFIDTPGAHPGIGAEERGQAAAIAVNLREMSKLKVPIISIVIGEGGSGGALGIGVGDELAMLEYSYYSVISPEGGAAILWKSSDFAPEAAEALKITSGELFKLGLIDDIIVEPLGGAHRNHHDTFYSVEHFLKQKLFELRKIDIDKLIEMRYNKIRSL